MSYCCVHNVLNMFYVLQFFQLNMMVDVIVSEESGNKNQSKGGSSVKFANRTRYVVLILAIATLTMVYSNSLAFNFTYICMKKEAPASLAQTDNRSSSSNVTTEGMHDSI